MSGWSFGFVRDVSQTVENPRMAKSHNSSRYSQERLDDGSQTNCCSSPNSNAENAFLKEFPRESRTSAFCTKDNLLNSIAYTNQELELLGLPCLKFEDGECTADVYFFINRLHDLLVLLNKTAAVKEDLETKNHQLSCEASRHQSSCMRMRREQDQLERELRHDKEKIRQMTLKSKQLSSMLKAEKEEVKRLTAVLQSRDVQYRHDNKKKEKEVISLKERLHQLLADKVPDRKVGMDLMNMVGSGEGRRATWKSGKGKQEEEMYQMVISNYEERHRELMQENSDLRDCLLSLQRELSGLLKRTGNMTATPALGPSSTNSPYVSSEEDTDDLSFTSRLSVTDINEGYIQMPFDLVRKEIERAFKDTCDQISDGMKQSLMRNVSKCRPPIALAKAVGSNFSDKDAVERRQSISELTEVDRLKKQIGNYKEIIQQQENLIQQSLHSHSQSVETSFLHESQLLKEKENLSEQKKLFFEEKTAFERERQVFTDAALRLGKERQALQEERASLLRQHLQTMSPMKENQQPKTKGDGHHPSRLLPATPVFSPINSGRSSSATTPVKSVEHGSKSSSKLTTAKDSCTKDSQRALNILPGETGSGTKPGQKTPSVGTLLTGPVVHFTPQPRPRSSKTASSRTATASATSPPPPPSSSSKLGLSSASIDPARLESIRASLLRIRRSAASQDDD